MSSLSIAFKQIKGRPKGNVFIVYSKDGKQSFFGTGVSVEKAYFNRNAKSFNWIHRSVRGYDAMNRRIKTKYDEIDIVWREIGLESENIKLIEALKNPKDKKKKEAKDLSFTELYEEYLENLPDKTSSTITAKKSALLHWREFAKRKSYILKEINPQVYDKFRTYLLKEFAPSTVGKTIKDVKACINWLNERGYIDAETIGTINLSLWKTKKQKPQNIHYLEMEELQRVINYNPKSNYLQKTKDLLILQCHTGLRISDLKAITRTGDVIRMKAQKTKEVIQVPLTSLAKSILEKHNDRAPKISDQKFNDYIKILLQEAGIDRKVDMPRYQFEKLNEDRIKRVETWQKDNGYFALKEAQNVPVPFFEMASSHMCVRTFITLAAELGMTPKVIATITGKTVKVILDNYLGTSEKTLIREMHAFDNAFNQVG